MQIHHFNKSADVSPKKIGQNSVSTFRNLLIPGLQISLVGSPVSFQHANIKEPFVRHASPFHRQLPAENNYLQGSTPSATAAAQRTKIATRNASTISAYRNQDTLISSGTKVEALRSFSWVVCFFIRRGNNMFVQKGQGREFLCELQM